MLRLGGPARVLSLRCWDRGHICIRGTMRARLEQGSEGGMLLGLKGIWFPKLQLCSRADTIAF
jgi:hypothetical protein